MTAPTVTPLDRIRSVARDRLWPVGLAITTLALVATFTSDPGRYIGDNRYDQFAAPGRRVAHTLAMWDGSRGLGRIREDLWLGFNMPLALLRGLGVPIWATERIFHALLISLAGVGLVAVVRVFHPRIGWGHLLGGLVFAFGPFSIAFLQPSNLYAAYAAAPWLLLCLLRGVASDRPWRWAAGFALTIGLLGNADPPGVVYATLPLLPAALWLVLVERSTTWRHLLGWLARAGVLSVGVAFAALFKTVAAASTFADRLSDTESPTTTNIASSWAETFRGLGFWLTYFRGSQLARPQTEVYFSNAPVILATFAIPAAAMAVLATRASRVKALLGGIALVGVVVMVGNYPLDDPSPYGNVLVRAYESFASLGAFRSTYKAGATLMIGVAGLLAVGMVELTARMRDREQGRALMTVGAFAVVAVAALPFVGQSMYDSDKGYDRVPAYWSEALASLDAEPGSGRVLVLPGTTRTQYRWGWVGDDIIDAMLRRDHAIDTAIPLSSPIAADLLHAVSEDVSRPTYAKGSVAPILRRLGIDRVVIRNDVDWEETRVPRPSSFDQLRSDPDLQLLRVYGKPGENTTKPSDRTQEADRERLLPPVEIYEVTDPGPAGPRGAAGTPGPVLVSGDGEAWPTLSRDGDLDGTGPVVYSGTLTDAEVAPALERADRVVITDTNRRRVTVVNGFNVDRSWTLAPGQDLDRRADDVYAVPGSQTTAWYRDATSITGSGNSRGLRGSQPGARPSAAFDGSPTTAWQTAEVRNQEGIRLRVDFKEPQRIGEAEVSALSGPTGVSRVTGARLRFSDGSSVPVDLSGRSTRVRFRPRTTDWVEVEITDVSDGAPRPVGLTEVSFPGIDAREWLSMPDDLVRRAEDDPAAARALAARPLDVVIERQRSVGPISSEPVLRRRFRLGEDRSFEVTGTIRSLPEGTVTVAKGLADECDDTLLRVDGEPVPVKLSGSLDDIGPGDAIPIEGCRTVDLGPGWHRVESSGGLVSSLRLSSAGTPGADARTAAPRVKVLSTAPGRVRLRVDAPDGGDLVLGQSWDPRWTATADGRDLGPALPLDTLSGWRLPSGGTVVVDLRYRPQQRFELALAVSAFSVAVCLVLVLRRRRGAAPEDEDQPAVATNLS